MLDPASIDLDELRMALDDHSPDTTWWISEADGLVVPNLIDTTGFREVGSVGSHEGYRDMAEFVAGVHHRRAAELLDRAIAGRGAFRRFKDTLFEFPELREQWSGSRPARGGRGARRWRPAVGLVELAAAERLMAKFPDPVAGEEDAPAALAVDLGLLYGDRLRQVLLFGSWTHGDGPGEHDLEVVVVLAELRSPWEELRHMDEMLWRHTERTGLTVVAVPVSEDRWATPDTPLLRRAAAEAVRVS